MPSEKNQPALSIILPTDSFATIQPVLERLRLQTIAHRIEVVLVAPAPDAVANARMGENDFAAIRIVSINSLALAAGRAAGIRAATAPLVFIGETHSYFQPDAAEKLVNAAASGNWASVAPGFENANPGSVCSWAGFLADYARWNRHLPAGEISDAPLYNALYRREVLLLMKENLEEIFSHGDRLFLTLEAGGYRAHFEPSARIAHVNLDRWSISLHEQFLAGLLIASRRAIHWPWWRRMAYIGGAGLIPFVLFWRMWPGIRRSIHADRLPLLTIPGIFLLMCAKSAGELIGYAGARAARYEAAMDRYEIHKADYVA